MNRFGIVIGVVSLVFVVTTVLAQEAPPPPPPLPKPTEPAAVDEERQPRRVRRVSARRRSNTELYRVYSWINQTTGHERTVEVRGMPQITDGGALLHRPSGRGWAAGNWTRFERVGQKKAEALDVPKSEPGGEGGEQR